MIARNASASLRAHAWPMLYLLWVVPFLLAIVHATPPWQNSDEPLHMARAVQVAHFGLVGYRAWNTSGGESDRAIYEAFRPVQHVAMNPRERPTATEIADAGQKRWSSSTQYTSFPNTSQYPPFFYIPDAAAYWAGRATGLGIDSTLTLARLANAFVFAAVTAIALGIARRSRLLLAAILMLPMTLSLACSAAQDSLMLAAIALAVALLDRAATAQRPATLAETLVISSCLAAAGMARPPYAGFLLVILATAMRPARRPRIILAAAAAAVLAWCLLVVLHTSVKLGGSDITRQTALLSADPGRILPIAVATLTRFSAEYWTEFIGKLGWTDTTLPFAYTIFASMVLLVAALACTAGTARSPWAAIVGIAFSVIAIFVLQYLTWTWPGQPVVTGVLGRYFLPPAMILALALPRLAIGPRIHPLALAALAAMAIVTPPVTIHALNQRYAVSDP